MIETISQSKANAFFRCAEQFRRIYLENERIAPGIALHKGRAVHSGAEHANRVKAATGNDAPLDEVTDATRDSFVNGSKCEGIFLLPEEVSEKRRILNEGLNESIELAAAYRIKVVPGFKEVAVVEEYMTADVGLELPISGKPDLTADGIIRDIKTAAKKWPAGKEDTEIQPTIYRMLLRENGKGELPAEFVILSNSKTGVNIDVRQASRTERDEQVLKHRLQVMIDMMTAGIYPPAEPGSWMCSPRWCGFYYQCKYCK